MDSDFTRLSEPDSLVKAYEDQLRKIRDAIDHLATQTPALTPSDIPQCGNADDLRNFIGRHIKDNVGMYKVPHELLRDGGNNSMPADVDLESMVESELGHPAAEAGSNERAGSKRARVDSVPNFFF